MSDRYTLTVQVASDTCLDTVNFLHLTLTQAQERKQSIIAAMNDCLAKRRMFALHNGEGVPIVIIGPDRLAHAHVKITFTKQDAQPAP